MEVLSSHSTCKVLGLSQMATAGCGTEVGLSVVNVRHGCAGVGRFLVLCTGGFGLKGSDIG